MPFMPTTKNAPDADQGIEGNQNRTHIQEGTDSTVSVQNTDDMSTADARWFARTRPSDNVTDYLTESDLMPPSEAPAWADHTATSFTPIPGACAWHSRTYGVVLKDGAGRWTSEDRFVPARVEMFLYQSIRRHEPRIRITRVEQNVDMDKATMHLSLDEAAELAHGILLAIDVARGTSDDIEAVQ